MSLSDRCTVRSRKRTKPRVSHRGDGDHMRCKPASCLHITLPKHEPREIPHHALKWLRSAVTGVPCNGGVPQRWRGDGACEPGARGLVVVVT